MIRATSTYLLVALLTLTGLTLAAARGANPDIGTEIAICSGISMTTIIVGGDGQPLNTTQACPDGASIFAAAFSLPEIIQPTARLLTAATPARTHIFTSRNELSPSARGPPALV